MYVTVCHISTILLNSQKLPFIDIIRLASQTHQHHHSSIGTPSITCCPCPFCLHLSLQPLHHNLMPSIRWSQLEHIGRLARMSVLDIEVDSSNPDSSKLFPWARHFIHIASVDSAVKWVPGGDNLMKDVQCYERFGGIALKNHAF